LEIGGAETMPAARFASNEGKPKYAGAHYAEPAERGGNSEESGRSRLFNMGRNGGGCILAGCKRENAEEAHMYQKILVPIDGSETAMRGLNEAIKVAKSQGSQLRLFHIVNEFVLDYSYGAGLYGTNLIESLREGGKKIIQQAEAYVRQQGVPVDSVLLEAIGGPAADLIVAQAKEWAADLIVMGTHGRRGLRRLALGSDAEGVVRESPIPVLLVHDMPKDSKASATAKAVQSDASKKAVA
jgi:nucleotide-binding universal stress UspA family protein